MLSPVSAVSLLACRDTLAAGLSITWSGLYPEQDEGVEPLPAGVQAAVWTALPRSVLPAEGGTIHDLHAYALGSAWSAGAWDLRLSLLPPLEGPELGLVAADADWSACDPLLPELLLRAAGAGRLVLWMWRPMRSGPAVRRAAHAARDVTLGPDGGREGAPPARPEPDWARRGGCERIIRLGTAPPGEARARPGPRATGRQRACIVGLRRRLGRTGEPLPAALTRREASAIITSLLTELP